MERMIITYTGPQRTETTLSSAPQGTETTLSPAPADTIPDPPIGIPTVHVFCKDGKIYTGDNVPDDCSSETPTTAGSDTTSSVAVTPKNNSLPATGSSETMAVTGGIGLALTVAGVAAVIGASRRPKNQA